MTVRNKFYVKNAAMRIVLGAAINAFEAGKKYVQIKPHGWDHEQELLNQEIRVELLKKEEAKRVAVERRANTLKAKKEAQRKAHFHAVQVMAEILEERKSIVKEFNKVLHNVKNLKAKLVKSASEKVKANLAKKMAELEDLISQAYSTDAWLESISAI